MDSADGERKSCCCSFISLAIAAILIWLLHFKTSSPTCSIEHFDVFALHGNTNNTPYYNNTVHYDLKLKNRDSNVNKGIYYDALILTFYYKGNIDGFVIGNASFSPFYQGHGKSTHRIGDINPRGVKWENITTSLVVFRVEMATAVRYKSMFWKTKRHRLVVGADLKVNEQGSLVKERDNKGIKLSSNSRKNIEGRFELVGILGILIFIHSSNTLTSLYYL